MVVDYPQSGERIRGWANVRGAHDNYPGGLPQDVDGKVIGSEDKWVVGPSFNVLRIEGTGDVYTLIGSARYPDGQTWQVMSLIELRSGKIAKTTELYGAPFDPPPWRSRWWRASPSPGRDLAEGVALSGNGGKVKGKNRPRPFPLEIY